MKASEGLARLTRWLAASGLEASPHPRHIDLLLDGLPIGAPVYIRSQVHGDHGTVLSAACRLRAAGMRPVPHVAVRRFSDARTLHRHLSGLAGEAGVERVLMVGGDADPAAGPLHDCMAAFEAGVLSHTGLRAVELAAYPEGHPVLPAHTLDTALVDKLAWLESHGLSAALVSQVSVDAQSIVDWHAHLQRQGLRCPLRLGVAAPAALGEHIRYASLCGAARSLDALFEQAAGTSLLTELGPDALLTRLSLDLPEEPAVTGLLLFGIGPELVRTLTWRKARIAQACAGLSASMKGRADVQV